MFAIFLTVFGRVRAKDLALKYRSNLYRGKNATSFRSGVAALTARKRHKNIEEGLEELNEEIDGSTKRSSGVEINNED